MTSITASGFDIRSEGQGCDMPEQWICETGNECINFNGDITVTGPGSSLLAASGRSGTATGSTTSELSVWSRPSRRAWL